MSGTPISFGDHPPHGNPANTGPSTQSTDRESTASHPPAIKPDPTTSAPHPKFHPPHGKTGGSIEDATQGGQSTASAASSSELAGNEVGNHRKLANLNATLKNGLRQFPDFPEKGILFEDIMPLFADHALHSSLIQALELKIADVFNTKLGESSDVDIVIGLESRGFLFGPTLALRLGAGFVPVRKPGKLPGKTIKATFKKEYGEDVFEMQGDAIKEGQKVVIVDDIIATGGSAQAAGSLVHQLGGKLLGYVFLMELDFLKGRDKLDAPVYTLLSGQEEALNQGGAVDDKLPLGRTKESAEEASKPVTDAGGSAAEQKP
ncbi:adenine phosphoribosyltransferase [Recurvomyces mirabilis]|uniref:adenine phosphoribosyltransferase n=1 Tax=Recurvomyces mirabilis TaxID=574656 RepID=A0AAE1C3I0_9PEZI|nr:adenine phosphoribosyltransferase [Recurvomyces mirabilis]KAK5154403.1 adenine phosphoribosyltransferase [Recurvomyces mirabilis]